jgi:iron complex transport system substrate-binding protein
LQILNMKLFAILLVGVCLELLACACDKRDRKPTQTQITVTDVAGRQVKIGVPVRRIVLGYAKHFPTLAAVAGKDFPGNIAGWGLSRLIRVNMCDKGPYIKFKEKFPELEVIPEVGSSSQGTFSVEKAISLKADVVICPLWMLLNDHDGTSENISRLERAGIPAVFIDYFAKPLENTIPSTLLLGTLLGKSERAQGIVDFYQSRMVKVVNRLQAMNKPKPKVYVEHGSMGPSEIVWAFGNYAWGAMVVKAGGINITEGIIKNRWGPMNPEYLIKTDADVIIISGPEPSPSMRAGYHAYPEESRLLLKAFTERPGWSTLSAVKNGRVYGILNSLLAYNVYNFAILEAMAKWFYPVEFKELDPQKDIREFHRRFLPIDDGDEWMIGICN